MSVIDDYLATVDANQRKELQRIRKIVQHTVPEAEETISYGMPAFKYKKKYLIAFAPFKDHLSIFPGAGAVEHVRSKLDGHTLSKGTIQFTEDNPLSESLLQEVVLHRVKAIDS